MAALNLRQLEYFVCISEVESFSRAADILHVAQPALSRQIRQLEDALGAKLLVRNGRGAVPTEVGELFLNHCRGILRQIETAQSEISEAQSRFGGRTTIGMPSTVSAYMGMPLIRKFREEMPDVNLELVQARAVDMQEALAAGKLDIGLLYNASPLTSVQKTRLLEDELMLVGPAASDLPDPAPLSLLAELPLILRGHPNMARSLVETELARRGLKLRIAMEIDSVFVILELVRDGAGHAILSRRTLGSSSANSGLTIRKLVEPTLPITLHMVRPHRTPTAKAQAAANLILAFSREFCG